MTTILLADDHPMIRTAIEVLLRDTDFEIVGTAGTGDEAFSLLGQLRPEILLLDLHMPGGSGMEVIRRLQSAGDAPPLLGGVLRHHAREPVALELRDQRERDAGVPARRLEQRTPRLELARRLGRLDHRLRHAVLDRAGGVLALELRVEADAVPRRQARQRVGGTND